MLQQLLSNIFSIGNKAHFSGVKQMKIRLSNIFALVVSLTAFSYILVLLIRQHPLYSLSLHFLVAAVGIMTMILNKMQRFELARALLIATLSVAAFGFSLVLGKASNALIMLGACILLAHLLYEQPNYKWFQTVFCVLLFFVGWLLAEKASLFPDHFKDIRAKIWDTAPILDSAMITSFILFLTIRYLRENERYQSVIEQQKTEIELQKSQLEVLHENLLEQNSSLENSERELLKMNEAKTKLLTVLSHDLKNAMLSLKYGLSSSNQAQVREQMEISVDNTYHFIENLLRWSMSEMSMQRMELREVNFNKIVESNEKILKVVIDMKKIRWRNELNSGLTVWGDEDLLHLVFRNLLFNSLKHTPDGGEIVIRSSESEHQSCISVIDNGVGIPKDLLDKIWTRSWANPVSEGTSTGLGLYICKDCVERMNGSIELKSELGKGTSVDIYLPKIAPY